MPRSIYGVAFLLPLIALSPARANCYPTPIRFSQVATGTYHYVLLPAGSQATDTSLVGRFWQLGNTAVNQGDCDETNWLHRCGTDCTVQSDGPAFWIDGDLESMPCNPGCPSGEMVVLLEDLNYYGEFLAARVDESPGTLFDYSRLGVDLRPIAIPPPVVLSSTPDGTVTVRMADPAPGFYGLPGVPATGTITAFRLLTFRGNVPPVSRTAWTEAARFPYTGGTTTGTAFVGDPCPSNDPRPLQIATALELEGTVLTAYVSAPKTTAMCPTERAYGGGHAAETGSDALHLSRSADGELTLTWGPPCVTPNGFAVYEGVLGDWTSHVPLSCYAVSPATISEPAGNAYYLIVPEQVNINSPDFEGSYGLLRDGSERPRGTQTCIPDQYIVACP
jgi:hypothetical protein